MIQKRTRTKYIVIHCAATSATQDIGAREIDVWHRKRGFLRIGYHYVIRRNGLLEYGRQADEIGAHAENQNHWSVGICMVGGTDADDKEKAENNFTEQQWRTLVQLLTKLRADYPQAEILGHRDLPDVTKACPSFDVRAWLKEIDFDSSQSGCV